MIQAKVICHSRPEGTTGEQDLITMEVEFHRFILPEINTHRVLSRNYQSSRAVPTDKLLEQIKNDPAMPVHWGKNQRGMVAEEEQSEDIELSKVLAMDKHEYGTSTEFYSNKEAWEVAALNAALAAEAFHEAGYHKQIVNRLLEPFMWTRGVITATRAGWDSLFALRCHPDAQPEFQALAYKIRGAINESTPKILKFGEWHLPYVESVHVKGVIKYFIGDMYSDDMEFLSLEEAIKISTSCCAQVSYRQLDDSLEKALKIYDMLNLPANGVFSDKPGHFSPCEHQATYGESVTDLAGNFGTIGKSNWVQYRKMLEYGYENYYIKESE